MPRGIMAFCHPREPKRVGPERKQPNLIHTTATPVPERPDKADA